jgi:hypothetical protein
MAPAYLLQAPVGVAGDQIDTDNAVVMPSMLVGVGSPAVYPSAFGVPMKWVTGGIQQFNGGAETKTSFAGVLLREVPEISGSSADDATYGSTPLSTQLQGLLTKGSVSVVCAAGTPVRGGTVYIQIVADGAVGVGAFRSTADGSNTIALDSTQAYWGADGVGPDGNGNTNIAKLIVQTVL